MKGTERNMNKIGISSCGFALTEENFAALAENGIEAIEIAMATPQHKEINYRELAALRDRYGVELWSYHLPFAPFRDLEISTLDRDLRLRTVAYFEELIARAADIGIDKFVIHPSGEPIPAEEREDRMGYSMESLDRLAEFANRNAAVIAVEDLPRTCLGNTAADMQRLLGANDKLRVCFDTNHLLADTNLNFIRTLGDKIITVHVSDYDFVDEKHWLPGEGSVDWNELYTALTSAGYRGAWLYELGLRPPKTLARSRDLTFADFARNAREIMAGEKLTRIS